MVILMTINIFLVRFDDGDVKRWNYVGSTSQSSDIIFISNEKKFLKLLTNSNKIYITINLYQDGQHTFVFNPKGLKEFVRNEILAAFRTNRFNSFS